MVIGNKEFDFDNKVYIMGILNVTPDSFSDGGKWNGIDKALKHAEDMIAEGADIIDIGGESTRPGYMPVKPEEEVERIAPFIEKINENFDTVISVDTYKAYVAERALELGAHMINDIWGFRGDDNMVKVVAKYDVPCCIMHNRDNERRPYGDIVNDVIKDLKGSMNIKAIFVLSCNLLCAIALCLKKQ